MSFSFFTKTAIPLLVFLVSCQSQTPTTVSTLTVVATTTPFPTSTPTSDPEVISPDNAYQIVLKSINMGKTYGAPFYSQDGKKLYGTSNVGIYAYDTATYKSASLLASIPMSTLSPNGQIAVTEDGSLFSVDGNSKSPTLQLPPGFASQPYATQTKFSPDSSLMARNIDFLVAVWRLADGKLIGTFAGGSFSKGAMELSADNRLLAIQLSVGDIYTEKSRIYLYDLETNKKLGDWAGERPKFLLDGSLVIESEGYIRILDPKAHQVQRTFEGKFAAFSSDEQNVAILLYDGIYIYRVSDGRLLHKLEIKLFDHIWAELAFSPDGQTLTSSIAEAQCCGGGLYYSLIWRVTDKTPLVKLNNSGRLLFSPDGQTILTGGKVLRTSDGSWIADLNGFINSITNLAFTPDSQQILVAGYQDLYLYQVDNGSLSLPQKAEQEKYLPVLKAASPNSFLGLLYDTEPPDGQTSVFSPDGKRFAYRTKGVVTVSGKGYSFTVPVNQVTRLAFSPDGRILALGLWDSSVELWNLDGKQKVYTIPPRTDDKYNFVGGLAFSPDGKLLAIGLQDGTLRLYGIDTK